MLFRQLNIHRYHTGTVAEYYFVKRGELDGYIYLLTKDTNGWGEEQLEHYTNFKLEIIK